MARSHDSSVFLFSCRAVYLGCAPTAKLDGSGDSSPLRAIQKPLERLYGGGVSGGVRGGDADGGIAPMSERPRGAFVTVFSTGVQLEVSGGGGGEPSQLFFWFSVDRLLLAAAVCLTAAPGGRRADAKPWRPRRRKDRPAFAEAGSPQTAYSRHPALLALVVAGEPLPTEQQQHRRRRQGRARAADCHCLVPSSDAQARLLETACRFACANRDALADDVHEMWQDAMSGLSISGGGRYDNGGDGGAVDYEGGGEGELIDTKLTSVSDSSSLSDDGDDDDCDRSSYNDDRHRNGYHIVPPEIYDDALRARSRNSGTARDNWDVGANWQLNGGGNFSAASYPTERSPTGPGRRRPGSPPRSPVAHSGWRAQRIATRSHEGGGSRRSLLTVRNDAPWPVGHARLFGNSGRTPASSVHSFAAGHADDGRLLRLSRERAHSEAGSTFGQSPTRARSVEAAVSRHSSREIVAPAADNGSAWPRDREGALDGGGGGGGSMVVSIPRVLHPSASSGRWEAHGPTLAASQQAAKARSVPSERPGADLRRTAETAAVRVTAVAERARYATVSSAAVAERPTPRSKTSRPQTPPEDYRDDIPWVAAAAAPRSGGSTGEQARTGSLKRTAIQVRAPNSSGGGRTESDRPPRPLIGTPQRPQMPPPPPPPLTQPPPPPPPPLPRAYTVSGDGAAASRVLTDRRSDLMRSIREYVNERAFAQSLEAEQSRTAAAANGGSVALPQ